MPVIKSKGYSVVTGNTAFKSLSAFLNKKKYNACFILCDDNTLQHCLPALVTSCPRLAAAEIIEIENGEASKSLEFCAQILQTLIEFKAGRNTLLINLGGGLVSDLGGFAASVYKRGIDFINIPTSLLAMADASVGGKTGIDFAGVKNSVGTFAQPQAVFIHPAFLNTLPPRHYRNGLAEIYKIALVADKKFWHQLAAGKNISIENLIEKSVGLKNQVVLKDPYDKGIRKILNFGHTVGHAIEALYLGSNRELLHGEAIVHGMIMESHIAFQKKLINKKELTEIHAVLLDVFEPEKIVDLLPDAIIELMWNDKKVSGSLNFSLPCKTGSSKFDVTVSVAQVRKAMAYYNSLFE